MYVAGSQCSGRGPTVLYCIIYKSQAGDGHRRLPLLITKSLFVAAYISFRPMKYKKLSEALNLKLNY